MAETDADTRITIAKFDGENFHLWKFKMQMMLKNKGLWDTVEGGNGGKAVGESEWKRKEERALALIVLSLSDGQLMHVQNSSTAREAWDKLCNIHERKGLANKLYLRRKFLTAKMEEGGSMAGHINKIKMMAQQLEAIGAPASEDDIVTTLLYSLPESFEQLIVSLESRADSLDLEFLTARLLNEETQRSEGKAAVKAGKAFTSASGPYRGKTQQGKKKGKCHNCGKLGHFASDCWSKKKLEQQANKASTRALGQPQDFLFLSISESGTSEEWIIDSGASQHMTHQKELLQNFKLMDPVKVHLADGRTMEAIGKGLIGLSGTDGTAICRFREVWFIPELGRNLLSVSQLTRTGAKVKFDDLGCSIVAKDGREAFRARKEGGLYLFSPQKSEKANSASAENQDTVTRSLKSTSLELGHRRLGHLNTASVKELS